MLTVVKLSLYENTFRLNEENSYLHYVGIKKKGGVGVGVSGKSVDL